MVERAGYQSASEPDVEPMDDNPEEDTRPPVDRWVIDAFGAQLHGPVSKRPVASHGTG